MLLVAPDIAAFLQPPLLLVDDLDGMGVLGLFFSFLIPGSSLIPDENRPVSMMIGSFLTPLTISLNRVSTGASTIPSGSSVLRFVKGTVLPVNRRFTNRPCSEERGLTILTAKLWGMRLSVRMRCSSAA